MINRINYESILAKLEQKFYDKHSLFIITAAELEFYFSDDEKEKHTEITNRIYSACHKNQIPIEKIIKEQGDNQYEVIFPTFRYATDTAKAIIETRKIIEKRATEYNVKTYFSTLPFENKPPSGLHIHVSLHNDDMKNAFAKGLDEDETDFMIYSANGLCELMAESMIFFASSKKDYTRFQNNSDSIVNCTAPQKICWGGNNRTTSIRIPSSTVNPNERNLEHRVPCPDSDPYKVLSAIIIGINYGIENKINNYPKIYGNAFDEQYNLHSLPKSLKDAKREYKNGEIIKKIL